MKKILLSIIVFISLAAQAQKNHYGLYEFDSLYSKLAQQGIDTTNFKIVVQRVSDGKYFKMYWPVFGASNALVQGSQNLSQNTSINLTGTYEFRFSNATKFQLDLTSNGTDAAGDLFYRGSDNYLHRIAKGTPAQNLHPDGSGGYVWKDTTAVPTTTQDVTVLKNYVIQTTSTGSGTTDNITIVTIPANTLVNNGDEIEIDVAYTTTGSDTKNVDVVIGSSGSLVGTTLSTTAAYYVHKIKVLRTSSTAGIYRAETWRGTGVVGMGQTLITSYDWTSSQNLVVSLTSTTAASITINYVTVKVYKENLAP